jgi:hypothetical protein
VGRYSYFKTIIFPQRAKSIIFFFSIAFFFPRERVKRKTSRKGRKEGNKEQNSRTPAPGLEPGLFG